MKDVSLNSLSRPILRPGRGSTCCGVRATTVHPVSARVQGVAERHLERGTTMTDAANPSGLSDEEAQEFHQYFIQGYLLWAVGAFVAHSLVWIWRPWF